jgi:hypothetical protein
MGRKQAFDILLNLDGKETEVRDLRNNSFYHHQQEMIGLSVQLKKLFVLVGY